MNDKTAFGNVIATCDNCRKLIYEGDTHYYARYQQGEFCLCEQCVTVVNPEPLNINRTYNQTADRITNIRHVEVFNG